jgi:hypothetical protein
MLVFVLESAFSSVYGGGGVEMKEQKEKRRLNISADIWSHADR